MATGMRTVYLGTSEFAADVLRRLADSPHRPSLVVSRPSRPKGRGRNLQDPPVVELARELGIATAQPENVNEPEATQTILAQNASALVVCAFGALVKEPLLSALPIFNLHPSLLPRWRGAAPIERAIASGDERTGTSIMALVEELDAGPVCVQREITIAADDDYGSISARLAEISGELLIEALDSAVAGSLVWREQSDIDAAREPTYAEKITADDRHLNPSSAPAVELERMIRALHPHIGAVLGTAAGPLRIEQARLAEGVSSAAPAAGTVIDADGRLLVGTQDGTLELLRVRPAGGKSMDAASFLRGNNIPELVGR